MKDSGQLPEVGYVESQLLDNITANFQQLSFRFRVHRHDDTKTGAV